MSKKNGDRSTSIQCSKENRQNSSERNYFGISPRVGTVAMCCGATTVAKLWEAEISYHVRIRMTGDIDRLHAAVTRKSELLEMSDARTVSARSQCT